MVNLQGLNGIPEPKSGQTSRTRNDRGRDSVAQSGRVKGKEDGVSISNEAKAAADVSRIVQLSRSQEDIRLDKVESARQNITDGKYKDPEVVAKVAEKLLKLLG